MYKLGKMIFIVFLISLTIVGCSNGVEDVSDNTYTLKIQKGGEGEGNIIKPDGKGEYQYKEDTVVTLTTGEKLIVQEGVDEVVEAVINYKREIRFQPE